MVGHYAAYRRLERFLMNYGFNPQEPPDDRKTYDDMLRFPRPAQYSSGEPPEGSKLIAVITYKPDKGEISIERVVD